MGERRAQNGARCALSCCSTHAMSSAPRHTVDMVHFPRRRGGAPLSRVQHRSQEAPSGLNDHTTNSPPNKSSPTGSLEIVEQIEDTLSIFRRRLRNSPDLELLVQSLDILLGRVRERIATFERLLPRLRNVVAKQREELRSSQQLLEQANQAHLRTRYELKMTQIRDQQLTPNSNSQRPAHPSDRCDATTQTQTEHVATSSAAKILQEVSRLNAEVESQKQTIKQLERKSGIATSQLKLMDDIVKQRTSTVAMWRRKAEFQESVNAKLQRVIKTQEKLLRSIGVAQAESPPTAYHGRAQSPTLSSDDFEFTDEASSDAESSVGDENRVHAHAHARPPLHRPSTTSDHNRTVNSPHSFGRRTP